MDRWVIASEINRPVGPVDCRRLLNNDTMDSRERVYDAHGVGRKWRSCLEK